MTETPQPNKQTKPGDGKHPDKKSMQSGERHHQATSDYKRFILGRYNPYKEVANMINIDKSYLKKLKPL